MLNWTATAAMTFIATNIDDLLILVLLFSQVGPAFRRRHIVAGQTLGFATLVALSLALGLAGGILIPEPWLALLGLVPLALGVRALFSRDGTVEEPVLTAGGRGVIAVPAFQVAALTVASGGDNVGVYVPLFARSNLVQLLVTLIVLFGMLAVWLAFGMRLTRRPVVAGLTARYGRLLMPLVLILLGVLILAEGL